jgi:hypothetical protein
MSMIVASALLGGSAGAALVDLGPGSFTAAASVITFDDIALGTINPTYSFPAVPGLGDVTVSFGGYFVGQSQGGAPPTLLDSTPDNPLALDPAAPEVFTVDDAANPGSPVLSGTPIFAGTIAVLFSTPVAGVGLQAGYFDAVGSTTIEAYDGAGNSLGTIVNGQLGLEFYGLADSTGQNIISGISFYITGEEPAGYAINDVTFGAGDVIVPVTPGPVVIPAPAALILAALGSGLAGLARRRNLL